MAIGINLNEEESVSTKSDKVKVKGSVLSRLLKSSTIKSSAVLSDSIFFNDRDMVATDVYILNLALSGKFDGGLTCGSTLWAGPSRHFKTSIALVCVAAYLKKYKDAVCIYYDSEHGSTPDYVAEAGVDVSRVIHSPVEHIEQLKFDIVKQLKTLERGDKVIFLIDSIGNLASIKELEDAENEKVVGDMTRAKSIKSLFRMITTSLNAKDLPCHVICHTYETMELYSKQIISGGTGLIYSSNNAFIIGKQQIKDGTELTGFNFILNAEKSRFIKEKAKLPLTVTFEGGINKYSGLFELALDLGHVIAPKQGWYQRRFLDKTTGELKPEDKSWRMKDTSCDEFWLPVFEQTTFKADAEELYKMNKSHHVDTSVDDEAHLLEG